MFKLSDFALLILERKRTPIKCRSIGNIRTLSAGAGRQWSASLKLLCIINTHCSLPSSIHEKLKMAGCPSVSIRSLPHGVLASPNEYSTRSPMSSGVNGRVLPPLMPALPLPLLLFAGAVAVLARVVAVSAPAGVSEGSTGTSPTANVVITASTPAIGRKALLCGTTAKGRKRELSVANSPIAFAMSTVSNGPQPPSKSCPQLVLAVTRLHGFPRHLPARPPQHTTGCSQNHWRPRV